MAPGPLALHVFPSFETGGAQLRTARVIGGLDARLRHAILPLDGCTDARQFLPAEREVEFIEPPTRAGTVATARALVSLLRARRPDLLCTYNWGSTDAAIAGQLAGGLPHVHHEDGFGREELARPLRRRSIWRRIVLSSASALIVPSRRLEQVALENWRFPRRRVQLVPNGVDLPNYHPADGNPALRRELGIGRDAPVLGSVGGLRPEKNFGRLVEVFASLPPELGAHLVLVGDGVEREVLETRARRGPGGDRCHFVGLVRDPRPYYSLFDLFALTSDTEQMPLALVEAMASSLPAIASDVGDVRAILPPGSQERIVAPTAPDAVERLAAAAATLLGSPQMRRAQGAENRARVEERYSLAGMLKRYSELYGAALGPVKAAAAGLR
ncbi:glycosyltransferase [Engelhardtia mirabilis]